MLRFSVTIDGLEDVKKMLSKDLLKSVLEKTVNDTLADVKKAEVEEMKRIFKSPTPFVLNSLYVWRANRNNLEGYVSIKDAAIKILAHHIFGGTRPQKRSEKWLQGLGAPPYWIPAGGARFNKAGNISAGQITQILSATGANPDPYSRTTARSRKRNKAMPNYFVIRHWGGHLKPGVYQRMAGGRIKPVLIFVEHVNYPIRFDWFGVAERTVARVINKNFSNAFNAVFKA